MDPTKLSRPKLDWIRLGQALAVLAGIVGPSAGFAAEDATGAVNVAGSAVGAISLAVTYVLEIWKRRNVTPLADPKLDDGTPLEPVVHP